MDRRNILKVLVSLPLAAEGGFCQHSGHTEPPYDLASYRPRFFTSDEYRLLDTLCETILPADKESGGAHAAGVAFYLDTKLVYLDEALQKSWRSGLAALDHSSHGQFGRKFADLEAASRSQLLALLLAKEASPESPLEQFAVRVKAATIEGYCLSDVGFQHFGYRGNTALAEFPGCTHPEHKLKMV